MLQLYYYAKPQVADAAFRLCAAAYIALAAKVSYQQITPFDCQVGNMPNHY